MTPRYVPDTDSVRMRHLQPMTGYDVVPGYMGSYGGFGDYGPGITPAKALQIANSFARKALPPPVWAAVNASPLSSKQKRLLKSQPLSVLIVAADFAADKFVSFINRVNRMGKKQGSYSIGGRRVAIAPNKRQPPAQLAAQFLTVAYYNPVEAAIVAGQMHLEIGVSIARMTGAALTSAAQPIIKAGQQGVNLAANLATQTQRAATQAAQQAGQTTQQIMQEGQKAFDQGVKTVASWFGFKGGYAGFGDGGVVSGPTAAAAVGGTAAAGAGLTAEGLAMSAIAALIAMAPTVVPMLISLASEKLPGPPTQQQIAASAQAAAPGGAASQAAANVPPAAQQQMNELAAHSDKILGLPRPVAIGGGVVLVVGSVLYAARRK